MGQDFSPRLYKRQRTSQKGGRNLSDIEGKYEILRVRRQVEETDGGGKLMKTFKTDTSSQGRSHLHHYESVLDFMHNTSIHSFPTAIHIIQTSSTSLHVSPINVLLSSHPSSANFLLASAPNTGNLTSHLFRSPALFPSISPSYLTYSGSNPHCFKAVAWSQEMCS